MADDQKRQLETLQHLLEIPAADLKTTLIHATDSIAAAFRADKVDAFLYEPQRDALVAVGSSNQPLSALQHKHGLDVLPVANGGRVVYVYVTGKTYMNGHLDEDKEELLGVRETLRIKSKLGVPLNAGGKRRGMIMIASLERDHFTGEDARFAEIVSRWMGSVVDRASLVEVIARNSVLQGRRDAAEELITVFAHDMRNQIAPIAMRLQFLQRRSEKDGREFAVRELDLALRALGRLGTMVSDILDVARLDHGMFQVEVQPLDVVALLRDIGQTLSTAERPVLVRVQADEDVVAAADPHRARQCVENLLSNALKHSPEHAPVTVVISREKQEPREMAVVQVIDEGPGVPPEVLPRMFERFVTGSQKSGGVGLGLYLAKRVAQLHGGDVKLESAPGKGARFTLTLPIYENLPS